MCALATLLASQTHLALVIDGHLPVELHVGRLLELGRVKVGRAEDVRAGNVPVFDDEGHELAATDKNKVKVFFPQGIERPLDDL